MTNYRKKPKIYDIIFNELVVSLIEVLYMSIEEIKKLGKNKCEANFDKLIKMYGDNSFSVEQKREIVSSIGRQNNQDRIYNFIKENMFKKNYMDVIYQMFRTTLVYYKEPRFRKLCEEMLAYYNNEVMNKMYEYKLAPKFDKQRLHKSSIKKPMILWGDSSKTMKNIADGDINLIFTSPPYYNAREYSDYTNYKIYLNELKKVFTECNRILQDGRFLIVDVSPVITRRPGREYASIRYPIHFDLHNILLKAGFHFIDEIIWEKPEPSVPNRIGGYVQTHMPLTYKPNCVTESIMVYRKNCDFLLDRNINMYTSSAHCTLNDDIIDRSNIWKIAPASSKKHPAIFPEELCRRILKYYSFKGDVVLDPFAGIGTLGRVAYDMERIPVMCEINENYVRYMKGENFYDDFSKTSN